MISGWTIMVTFEFKCDNYIEVYFASHFIRKYFKYKLYFIL